jgi:hypothetical protein
MFGLPDAAYDARQVRCKFTPPVMTIAQWRAVPGMPTELFRPATATPAPSIVTCCGHEAQAGLPLTAALPQPTRQATRVLATSAARRLGGTDIITVPRISACIAEFAASGTHVYTYVAVLSSLCKRARGALYAKFPLVHGQAPATNAPFSVPHIHPCALQLFWRPCTMEAVERACALSWHADKHGCMPWWTLMRTRHVLIHVHDASASPHGPAGILRTLRADTCAACWMLVQLSGPSGKRVFLRTSLAPVDVNGSSTSTLDALVVTAAYKMSTGRELKLELLELFGEGSAHTAAWHSGGRRVSCHTRPSSTVKGTWRMLLSSHVPSDPTKPLSSVIVVGYGL